MTPTRHLTTVVDGLEVFHREAGPPDAPAVLLLHGFPTSSRMYRELIPRLSDRYRVLAPDLPGFGSSSRPERGETGWGFDAATDVVEKWLDAVGVTTFTLYLMDFGGSIGWRLALRRPDAVRGIVVQNAPLYSEDGGDFGLLPEYWRNPSPQTRAAARDEAVSLANTKAQYLRGVPDPTLVDPDLWRLDQAQLERPGVAEVMADYLFDISRQGAVFASARDWLKRTQPPLLVVSGRHDVIFPEASQHRFLDDVPGAQLHLQDTGHFALATHLAPIAALVRTFLDGSEP